MKKPHLEVTELHGKCSECDVYFTFGGKGVIAGHEAAITALREQFRTHFRKVHLLDDASQAAVRIVREATEDRAHHRDKPGIRRFPSFWHETWRG
jgi:hypothetical protein